MVLNVVTSECLKFIFYSAMNLMPKLCKWYWIQDFSFYSYNIVMKFIKINFVDSILFLCFSFFYSLYLNWFGYKNNEFIRRKEQKKKNIEILRWEMILYYEMSNAISESCTSADTSSKHKFQYFIIHSI